MLAETQPGGRSVGKIQNAKEALPALRPNGSHRCPDYHESDSIAIARKIEESGAIKIGERLTAESLECFRDALNRAFAQKNSP